jgi:hypothetical protein
MRVLISIIAALFLILSAAPAYACRIPVAVRGVFDAEPYALPDRAQVYTGRITGQPRDTERAPTQDIEAGGTFVGLLERPGHRPLRLYASMTSCHGFGSFTPDRAHQIVHVVGYPLPDDAQGGRLAIYSRWPGGEWFDGFRLDGE